MAYAVAAFPQAVLPIVNSAATFPVRRIYCVGRNYAAHAREMGFDPDRELPFFFMKPADAIVPNGGTIAYQPKTTDLQFEMELVVAIGKGGRDIPVAKAMEHVFGYAAGIDMTRRDLQIAAREKGRPWELGKSFDQSAPCSALVAAAGKTVDKGAIWLKVNGEIKQNSDLSKLIWSVPEVISYLSSYMEFVPGDIIYTGTPEGVGPVVRGDVMTGGIEGIGDITITVAK
jgi:fumarylpyruvate hydrolase